jgi:RNA polymerase sigma factor (sigma-70 family)
MRASPDDDSRPPKYRFVSDEQWRQDILREDHSAIQHIIDFCLPITRNYIGRCVVPDYEQVAVDVAMIVCDKLKTEHVDSLRSWIRRICRNTCFSLLRKEFPLVAAATEGEPVRRLKLESLDESHGQIPHTEPDPVEQDLPEIDTPQLRLEDLEGLTEREKRIVALFLEGHRPPEIAAIMDITVNNVRASWNQLLKKLRKLRQR